MPADDTVQQRLFRTPPLVAVRARARGAAWASGDNGHLHSSAARILSELVPSAFVARRAARRPALSLESGT